MGLAKVILGHNHEPDRNYIVQNGKFGHTKLVRLMRHP